MRLHSPFTRAFFRIALRFESTYVGSFMSMETNVITMKMQRNAENACVNRVVATRLKRRYEVLYYYQSISLLDLILGFFYVTS